MSALRLALAIEIVQRQLVGAMSRARTGGTAEGTRRLLVIDDEPAVLRLGQRVFEDQADLEVVCAPNPTAALRAARSRSSDVASAYRRDPAGGDPLAELRRAFPELPIVPREAGEADGDGHDGRWPSWARCRSLSRATGSTIPDNGSRAGCR